MTTTLTPDAVLAMPAGEAMDVLVATMVLGWRKEPYPADVCASSTHWVTGGGAFVGVECPLFSDDLGDAEIVLDWLHRRAGRLDIHCGRDGTFEVRCDHADGSWHKAEADTLPLALCRAALLETLREGK